MRKTEVEIKMIEAAIDSEVKTREGDGQIHSPQTTCLRSIQLEIHFN